MGIRAALYNLSENLPAPYLYSEIADDIPESLRASSGKVSHTEIGETNNTGIPIPWLPYFGQEDFQPANVRWNEETLYHMPMPCTTVEKARERILAAQSTFERIAGDADLGREYWQKALDLLDGLQYPFLALDHAEWIGSNAEDPEAETENVVAAFNSGAPSDEWLMEFCGYAKNVLPYSEEEWDLLVTHFDFSNQRQTNAIALGF